MNTDDIESKIPELVGLFYSRVRQDPDLGPIFNTAVEDWPEHLAKLSDFWSSIMLTTGRYKGHPMREHFKLLPAITSEHFDRWLSLWRQATDEVMGPEIGALFFEKATRIAESFKLGLFYKPVRRV
jgi:hemoglobin